MSQAKDSQNPGKRNKPIPEHKKKIVSELKNLLSSKRTILLTSIKNLPAKKLQDITKSMRGKAIIKHPKKNLMIRALNETKKEGLEEIKDEIKAGTAIVFSDEEPYELSSEFLKEKTPAEAKPGQEAPEKIEIPAGPTDLPPGPAITELSSIGLKVKIDKGKITIDEGKVVAEEGEKISVNVAKVMSKLGIRPFSIGIIPKSAFDLKEEKFYKEIKIDSEEAIKNLKDAFSKAIPFAVEINYPCQETISYIITKAQIEAKKMEQFTSSGEEEKAEEKQEESSSEESSEKERLESSEEASKKDEEASKEESKSDSQDEK